VSDIRLLYPSVADDENFVSQQMQVASVRVRGEDDPRQQERIFSDHKQRITQFVQFCDNQHRLAGRAHSHFRVSHHGVDLQYVNNTGQPVVFVSVPAPEPVNEKEEAAPQDVVIREDAEPPGGMIAIVACEATTTDTESTFGSPVPADLDISSTRTGSTTTVSGPTGIYFGDEPENIEGEVYNGLKWDELAHARLPASAGPRFVGLAEGYTEYSSDWDFPDPGETVLPNVEGYTTYDKPVPLYVVGIEARVTDPNSAGANLDKGVETNTTTAYSNRIPAVTSSPTYMDVETVSGSPLKRNAYSVDVYLRILFYQTHPFWGDQRVFISRSWLDYSGSDSVDKAAFSSIEIQKFTRFRKEQGNLIPDPQGVILVDDFALYDTFTSDSNDTDSDDDPLLDGDEVQGATTSIRHSFTMTGYADGGFYYNPVVDELQKIPPPPFMSSPYVEYVRAGKASDEDSDTRQLTGVGDDGFIGSLEPKYSAVKLRLGAASLPVDPKSAYFTLDATYASFPQGNVGWGDSSLVD